MSPVFIPQNKVTSIKNNLYWHYFKEKFYSSLPSKGLVLEIGGGTEFERLSATKKLFPNLIELGINNCNSYNNLSIINVTGDGQFLPFKDSVFDTVVTHHVIEHVSNDLLFLQEIWRVLKKNGVAVVGTPNRNRLPEVIRNVFLGSRKLPYGGHIREYSEKEIKALAYRLPFSSIEVFNSFLGIWGGPFLIGIERCPYLLKRYCHFLFLRLVK